ncbi:MAG: hypothetical protein V1896_01700 [Candidatus Zambryskibacteria bacterium]
MPRRREVVQEISVPRNNRLPVVNGPRATFKQIEEGIINLGHPVRGVVVTFLSAKNRRPCYALIPSSDLTIPV